MKYSKALLSDKDMAHSVFNAGELKAQGLLSEIFGLDLASNDVLSVLEDAEKRIYEIRFSYKGRVLYATLSYESAPGDLLEEVLVISEEDSRSVAVDSLPGNYDDALLYVVQLLEREYDLDFTPLDPEEKDQNIKVYYNEPDTGIMETVFTHEDHEAVFKAVFRYVAGGGSSLTVVQHKRHSIYLD